jgi:hypothetical protein
MSISTKTKRVAEKFGLPEDEDDGSYIDFLHARRHCGRVPGRYERELAYVIEIQELEASIRETLLQIRRRDGARIFKEAKAYLQDAITSSKQLAPKHPPRRHRSCGKQPESQHHRKRKEPRLRSRGFYFA